MRIKRTLAAAVLVCLLLNLSFLPASAAGTEETQKMIVTDLAADGNKVTLTVDIETGSQATSGRIAVYYDEDMIELSDVRKGKLWKVEDTNTGLTKEERKGVSYAWADTRKLTEEGNLFTLTFEAKEAAEGKEIAVETRILELFSQEKEIPVKSKKIVDRITVDTSESGENEPESPNPQEDGNEDNTVNTANSGVRTGDGANLVGYILLGAGAVLVMLDAGKKKAGHMG